MTAYRLEQAIEAYRRREAGLSAAAEFAGTSVYHLMAELAERGIAPPAEAEKFVDGLKTLVETFGSSDALRQTIDPLPHDAARESDKP